MSDMIDLHGLGLGREYFTWLEEALSSRILSFVIIMRDVWVVVRGYGKQLVG